MVFDGKIVWCLCEDCMVFDGKIVWCLMGRLYGV